MSSSSAEDAKITLRILTSRVCRIWHIDIYMGTRQQVSATSF
jgi:hypothetical protein